MAIHKLDGLMLKATPEDKSKTKFLLEKYVLMKVFIRDFDKYESEETKKRHYIYQAYTCVTHLIERSHAMIKDTDEKKMLRFRYLEGHTHKETLSEFREIWSDKTIERRLRSGIITVAVALKMIGLFEAEAIKRININKKYWPQ